MAANLTATVATVVAVCAGLAVGMLAGSSAFGLDLAVVNIVGASTHLLLLGTAYGAIAVLVAAATSTRAAIRATVGLTAAAYLANSLLPETGWGQAWVKLSPWHYYVGSEPLTNGPAFRSLAVLGLLTLAASAGAVWAYDRRDLAD